MNRYIENLNSNYYCFRKESKDMIKKFDTDIIIKDDVVRWKTNNNVPPQEILDFWKFVGKKFNMEKSIKARELDDEKFFKSYRQNRNYSDEELSEMRAAFGEGETIIDIITGKEIIL